MKILEIVAKNVKFMMSKHSYLLFQENTMNFNQVFVVYKKELKDILRDKRTLISMVLVPLLLFPIMTGGLGGLMSSQIERIEGNNVTVVILNGETTPLLVDYLNSKGNYNVIDTISDSVSAVNLPCDR